MLSHQTSKEVVTYVVYSGNIKNSIDTYSPIMGGKLSKSEKILKAIRVVKDIKKEYKHDVESILYAFANKFLEGKDLEMVKEELKVTEIGKSLIDEVKKEKAIEIAKNLLDILSVEMIAKKTGLTIEEVEKLKKSSDE